MTYRGVPTGGLLFCGAILLSTTVGGCPFPPTGQPGVVGALVDCSEAAVHQVAINVMPDVATALSGGDWEASLTALAIKVGEDAVACAVQHIASSALHDRQASPSDDIASRRYENGLAWMKKHPVAFKQ